MTRVTTCEAQVKTGRFWTGLTLVLCFCVLGCSKQPLQAQVESGRLDLRADQSRLEDDVANLDGTWLFRWQEFVNPESFREGPPAGMFAMNVPSIWNGQFAEGEATGLSGEGFATYAMELQLPEPPPNEAWALMVDEVSTAHAIYAVTSETVTLVAKNGRVGQSSAEHIPQWSHRVGALPTSVDGKIWIVMHISNFSYARGGAWKSILLSTQGRLERIQVIRKLFSAGLLGILLVMALYHFARYLMRRSDLGSAWFTLLCVLVFAREFTISRISDYWGYVPTDAIFTLLLRFEFLSFFMAGPALMSFIGVVFPSNRYRRVTKLAWWVSVPYFLSAILFNTQFMSTILPSYYLVTGVMLVTTLAYFVECLLKQRPYAWVAMFGCFVIAVGAIHDILYANGYGGNGFWTTYCFGFFVLIESYLLAAQSTLAFKQVEESRQANLEKVKAQMESFRLERELSGALKTKIHIFSNVAHELNNPLNYVSLGADESSKHIDGLESILDRLFDGAEATPEGQNVIRQVNHEFEGMRKSLDLILSGSSVAANVIAEMRGLAEVDGMVREELLVESLLDGAMRRVKADQRPEVFEKVHFVEELENLDQAVEGNPYMLIHAISHILINAVRYSVMAKGQPKVWLSTRMTQTHWILSIQNNGPPIEAEAIQTLLVPGDAGETVRNLPVALALLTEQGASLRLSDTGQITGRVIFEIELPLVGTMVGARALEEI